MLGHLQLQTNSMLTVAWEDWSEVRSRGRAARRRRQGHRQRIKHQQKPDPKFYRFGDRIVAHPATMAALSALPLSKSEVIV